MSTPSDNQDPTVPLADAQELARQRALALELRHARAAHQRERRREAMLRRTRRAADLLSLAESLAHSSVAQTDYILQPKQTRTESEPAPTKPAPETTKSQ